ncbi:carbohydrate ABC transporter permease [Occultella gossypii]|uniref:Carbohydrate ABC transporter permease n=2 Tax=Occultella TaxID=2828348 RepID=A0ABS7SC78_9MICO|nr:carbohydrate ABC transporter permease [Occultella gossypii]MBZ2197961.1 carbohydrate ABC transporter permease [Occultella gossypii]
MTAEVKDRSAEAAKASVDAERAGKHRGRARPASGFDRMATAVVIAFGLLWLVPLLWALNTSFKPEEETTRLPLTWAIENPTLDAYLGVINSTDIVLWYGNSLFVSVMVSTLSVLVASMAAFALSRVPMAGKRFIFGAILLGIMIPSQALIVPLFQEMQVLGLLGTYWAVILPQVPAAVGVFVFKQFFDGLPAALFESAQADGAGWLRMWATIAMPLSRPAISAVAIFTFVWSWNALLWPLLTLNDSQLMTVTVGLATVQGEFGVAYAQIMASAILGALPLLAVFLAFQRQIVQGIANTGIK